MMNDSYCRAAVWALHRIHNLIGLSRVEVEAFELQGMYAMEFHQVESSY